MPRTFVFEMSGMRVILKALRALEEQERAQGSAEANKTAAMIENFRSQIYGPIAKLEPFMRGREWLQAEIIYERNEGEQRNNRCECGRACKGKMCASCWQMIFRKLYGGSSDGHGKTNA